MKNILITKDDIEKWFALREQIVNGWHMSDQDKQELIRLNHLIMEVSHTIHNDNMLEN